MCTLGDADIRRTGRRCSLRNVQRVTCNALTRRSTTAESTMRPRAESATLRNTQKRWPQTLRGREHSHVTPPSTPGGMRIIVMRMHPGRIVKLHFATLVKLGALTYAHVSRGTLCSCCWIIGNGNIKANASASRATVCIPADCS